MNILKVRAVFFTGTGTTERTTTLIAQRTAELLGASFETTNFSLPQSRALSLRFQARELIIFGVFAVAGRVPNVLLPYLNTLEGGGAAVVPVVLYGNRNYDDALIELRDMLTHRGARCIAAAAFIGEHSFSEVLAKGRPDEADLRKAKAFAAQIAEKVRKDPAQAASVFVPGVPAPYRGYYQPLDPSGRPAGFLKAKPITDKNCIDCKLCADLCPMGSIDREDVSRVPGLCIKCCACIKKCPVKAKSFQDENFIAHRALLEKTCQGRREPELFI
jgi:ferredoxin